jgi:anhydro-N-acetylmuramic acid kinase
MSGTSLDGVDAVLAEFAGAKPRVLGAVCLPFDAGLRAELLALNRPGENEIERSALAANTLARLYAEAVREVLARAETPAARVRAIGCHGQTVRHRPERGYTAQIGNAALLAELCGIRVVADFRSRDVAAGGQGAPLVPAFHAETFSDRAESRVVLNLGGIANLTWLPRGGKVTGFDTGPANCLLDAWAFRNLGTAMDRDGAWAAGGTPVARLLQRMLEEPYFAAPPPKSTGRHHFDEAWIEARLAPGEPPRDVQATLVELSARSIAEAIGRFCPGAARVIACGGGTRNRALMVRLAAQLASAPLETSERHGVEPTHVEALAFAWLARQALEGKAGNLPAVTGARGARVLGAIYPA